MPLELAELAAGVPFAASFAMAGGISVVRERRRRIVLNEAVHELRRPLQALALAAPGTTKKEEAFESSLRMAVAAVDRLDGEINGRPPLDRIDIAPLRQVVDSLVKRWRVRASCEERVVNLKWTIGDSCVIGDVVELTQALDNLISNALVHGSGEVAVEAKQVGGFVRVVVSNRKRREPAGVRWRSHRLLARISGRCRHGHGLRIVRRAAARSGGSFRLRQRGEWCEAVLALPLVRGRQ